MAQGPQRLPQHVARDRHDGPPPIAGLVEQQVIAMLEAELARADALLISYYRSGTISPNVVEAARAFCRNGAS